MAFDFTAADAILKEYYTHEKIQDLVYRDNPFLSAVTKNEDATGEYMVVPLKYGNPQNRSALAATAFAGTTTSKLAKFVVTWASDYGYGTIDMKTIRATRNDEGAFLRAAKLEVDGVLKQLTRSAAQAMFGNGSGSIGQVANSSFATTTLTVGNSTAADADSVVNFEVGQVLKVSDADGTGSLRTGSLTVTAVNRVAGTVTTSANLSTGISAIAQNDFIFLDGDHAAKMTGLKGWIPPTTSPAALFGVTRTTDKERLSGVYYDGSGNPIEESLIEIISRTEREGGRPDAIYCNHVRYRDLVKALGSKVQYVDPTPNSKLGVGARGIQLYGANGPVTVIADLNCPAQYAWCLQMDTWELASLTPIPWLFNEDGTQMLRVAAADSLEVRGQYYGNLVCHAPGYNGVVKLV